VLQCGISPLVALDEVRFHLKVPTQIQKKIEYRSAGFSLILLRMALFLALCSQPSKTRSVAIYGSHLTPNAALAASKTIPMPLSILKNLSDHHKLRAWCDSKKFPANWN